MSRATPHPNPSPPEYRGRGDLRTSNGTPMVYLSKIYTKTGDKVETGLGDGSRVRKDHPRIAAIGAVDELNAVTGLLLASAIDLDADIVELLRGIQNDLFDVGADLCTPQSSEDASKK